MFTLVSFQVNAYLSGPLSVAKQQKPGGIQKLLQGLPRFGLTKAEELQIINLAPKKIIELYLVSHMRTSIPVPR